MDVIGDIGGVYEVLIQFFGFFLFRISLHSFKLNVIKHLFFVQTKDEDIFKSKNEHHGSHNKKR